MIPGNSPAFSVSCPSSEPGHRLYLHENNHQTPNVLFALLYNGFRDSHFTRISRLRRHSCSAPYNSCGLLRPRLVSTLPFAAPRIFDNCIKSTSAGGQAEPCQVARAHGLRTAIYLVVAEPSAGRLCKEDEASPVYADITRTTPCPPVNFVIVRQPAGEPSACAVPSIGRAFGPKRPNFKTNLIPKSDSRAWSGSAGGLAAGESRFGKYRQTAFVNGARAGPRLRFGAATVKRER